MKKFFTLIAATFMAVGASAQEIIKTWDLTTINETDLANLAADDSNWKIEGTDGASSKRYCGKADWGKVTDYTLTSNGTTVLKYTDGLLFSKGGSNITATNIRLYFGDGEGTAMLQFSSKDLELSIPDLKKGQTVTVNYVTNGKNNISYYLSAASNLTVESGFAQLTEYAAVEGKAKVTADGKVTFKSVNGGVNITKITVTAAEDGDDDGGDTTTRETAIVNFPTSTEGYTITSTGTSTVSGADQDNVLVTTVKINNNSTDVNCIKFNKGYQDSNGLTGNHVQLTSSDGFKTGDIITVAGVYNNSAEKNASVTLFTTDNATRAGEAYVDVYAEFSNFINSRSTAGAPTEQTYTLTKDYETLYIGRRGNTATCVTTLKVTRPTTTGINTIVNAIVNENAPIYNLAGQRVSKDTKGILIQNGKKFVNK